MKCPACGNGNPAAAVECEYCGHGLGEAPTKRSTRVEQASPPPPPAAPNPSKRRTAYDPGPAPPVGRPTYSDDPFRDPPPPRPVYDPADPFRSAVTPRTEAAPARPRSSTRTLIESAKPLTAPVSGVLVVRASPDDVGRVFPLAAGRTTIGRNEDNDIALEDGRVSGLHAFLFLTAEGANFIDASTNGSMVDDQVVHGRQVAVKHGSVMRLGGSVAVLGLVPVAPAGAWEDA